VTRRGALSRKASRDFNWIAEEDKAFIAVSRNERGRKVAQSDERAVVNRRDGGALRWRVRLPPVARAATNFRGS
jgi:hypothetical protein